MPQARRDKKKKKSCLATDDTLPTEVLQRSRLGKGWQRLTEGLEVFDGHKLGLLS
jgi:hypothetical protein